MLYKFRLPTADAQQVTVTLTPTRGDSDLYIKLGEEGGGGGRGTEVEGEEE